MPYNNKVVYGGNTVIDLTDLDVTAGDVVSGVTFIMANGEKAVGTITIPTNISDLYDDVGLVKHNNETTITFKNTNGVRCYKSGDSTSLPMVYVSSTDKAVFGDISIPTTLQGSNGNSNGVIINTNGQHSALYDVVTKTVTVPATNAHSNQSATSYSFTVPTNYNAVAIAGWSSGNYRIRPTTHYISSSSGTLYAGFANTSASNVTSSTDVVFYILCLKATSA